MYGSDPNHERMINEPMYSGEHYVYRRQQSKPWVVAFWTSLLVSIVSVLILQLLILPYLPILSRMSPSHVIVPQLTNLQMAQANQVLVSLGLRMERLARQHDDKPVGSILSHIPSAGTVVAQGSTVRVIVSMGPASAKLGQSHNIPHSSKQTADQASAQGDAKVLMPMLIGSSLSRARQQIKQMGLQIGHISYGADEDKPPHWVLQQTPPAQTAVHKGTSVNLVINRDDL
jgi:serine/threonine-protein kinase